MAKSVSRDRTALVLAGGGITGSIYQVGVLRALDDVLRNRSVLDFDIYVGTSAGAFVAALLAVGLPPRALAEAARNPSLALQLRLIRHVFSPNLGEVGQRLRALPGKLPAVVGDMVRHRGSFLISDLFGFLSLALPSGVLDSSRLGTLLRYIHHMADVPDSFADLDRELHIVACELDSWERVVFSRDTRPAVAIPDAVAASCSIPMLFRPVTINGRHYVDGGVKGTAAIDVAIDRGARLVVVVNPLVPLDARGVRRSTYLHRFGANIFDLGVRGLYNQLARGIVHDGLIDHVRLLRRRHPEVDIVLIEPRPDDEKMFFHEVMSTSARMVVAQHGYESVMNGLANDYRHFAEVLGRHDIELAPEVLEERPWDVPVNTVETGEMPEKLERTIYRHPGRRPSERERRFASVVARIEAGLETDAPPERLKRAAEAPEDAEKPPSRESTGTSRPPRSQPAPPRRGQARPAHRAPIHRPAEPRARRKRPGPPAG